MRIKRLFKPISFICILILILPCFEVIYAQTFESHLPVVVIDTKGKNIQDEPKIMATMGIVINPNGTLNHPTDSFNNYSGYIGIEYRGQASQILYPKKNFSIETRNADGSNRNASLMGLPKENDWILYGPYCDKTLIRNALTFALGNKMGHYGSRCIFSELFINNNYQGLYILMEKIKIDINRVHISKLDPDDNAGDSLTGGYILKLDKEFNGSNGWVSKYKVGGKSVNIMYHDPKYEALTSQQKIYIKGCMDNFETMLNGPDFADPVNGYRKYIDINSFIDYFLISELTRNIDSYQISTFFYKERDSKGGKLVMGPLWDYNLAWGLAYYSGAYDPNGWIKEGIVDNVDDWPIPFWWDRLLQDESYKNQLKCRWIQLRSTVLSDIAVDNTIDSLVSAMGDAVGRNFNKWDIINSNIPPNKYIAGSFEKEIEYVKNWANDRVKWMDENMYGECTDPNGNVLPIVITADQTIYLPTNDATLNCQAVDADGTITAYKWTLVSGPNQATINSPYTKNTSVDGLILGEYVFSITVTDNQGGTSVTNLKLTVNNLVSIQSYIVENFNVYPNPFDDYVSVKISAQSDNALNIRITDLTGRVVHSAILSVVQGGSFEYTWNTGNDKTNLESGLYILSITSNGQMVFVNKIVKR